MVRTNLRARGCPTLPLADPVTRAGPATFLVHTTMRQCSKRIKIRIEGTVEYVHSTPTRLVIILLVKHMYCTLCTVYFIW